VAYRPTERTEARKAEVRGRIVTAARELIAHGGYAEAQVAAVAKRAGVATGTVYRHFPSKADLFAEVFRNASQHEVDAVVAAAAIDGGRSATERIAFAVETFARRALRGRRLAWALIAEPVDPAVEAERLVFRRAYRDAFANVITEGVRTGELPRQDPEVAAAALVGAIGEALVGPVSPTAAKRDPGSVVASLRDFCIRSVTGKEPASVKA
jgi:AcrR family transcriptional regulator